MFFKNAYRKGYYYIYRRNKKCVQPLKIRGFGLYVKKYKKIKKRLALLPWIRYTKRAVT